MLILYKIIMEDKEAYKDKNISISYQESQNKWSKITYLDSDTVSQQFNVEIEWFNTKQEALESII